MLFFKLRSIHVSIYKNDLYHCWCCGKLSMMMNHMNHFKIETVFKNAKSWHIIATGRHFVCVFFLELNWLASTYHLADWQFDRTRHNYLFYTHTLFVCMIKLNVFQIELLFLKCELMGLYTTDSYRNCSDFVFHKSVALWNVKKTYHLPSYMCIICVWICSSSCFHCRINVVVGFGFSSLYIYNVKSLLWSRRW